MKRSNKLKVPPAVRQAARQAAKAQEIKGLGKPKLQVTDGVSAAKMREQFREQKRTKWLWQDGDMVRFRDYQTGTNQMGMVVAVDTYHETLTVTSPIGLRTLSCREAKLMDRLDSPCDEAGE